jgi:hypothetical protein
MMTRTMRFSVLVLGLLVSLGQGTPARAQDAVGPPAAPVVPQIPKIVFDTTMVELGEIWDNETTTARFVFRNEGNAPLTITGIRCACGCTQPKLAKRQFEPGEEGVIETVFDPKGRSQLQRKSCTVSTNDPANPTVTLTFKTFVKTLVWAEPKFVQLAGLTKGQEFTQDLTIWARSEHFKVAKVVVDDGLYLETELTKPERVMKDGENLHKATLRVHMKGNAPVGWMKDQITVYLEAYSGNEKEIADKEAAARARTLEAAKQDQAGASDGPKIQNVQTVNGDEAKPAAPKPTELKPYEHLIRLPVVAQIIGDLQLSVQPLRLGVMQAEQAFNAEVAVVSRTGSQFNVEDVTVTGADGAEINFEVVPVEGEGMVKRVIKIQGVAPARLGMLRGRLEISTNVPGEEKLVVPFFGSVRSAG